MPDEGSADLVGAIRRDPWISEEQKKSLVHIYQSFRAATEAASGVDERTDDDADEPPLEATELRAADG